MKKIIIAFTIIIILMFGISFSIENKEIKKLLTGQVIYINNNQITIQDDNNIIYTFNNDNLITNIGDNITIEYDKELNKNTEFQEIDILNYKINDNDNILNDNGIFSDYYNKAYNKLQEMTIDEKIGQLLLVRVPKTKAKETLQKHQFGGYLFFERDFKNKTKSEVQKIINDFQEISNIPLITAIDEEGGKVSRISSNKNLLETPFKSSQELYKEGGFELIKKDTINKSNILKELGLNVNLAPVVDISTNENDYIYERSLGENYLLTSEYAKTVITASKNTGVSYTLKHFPGYGSNNDSHTDVTIDNRDLNEFINKDLLPFQEGINYGAELVLISHNIVTSLDKVNPASLSPSIHNLLRNELGFTGIIITDDIYMGAISNIENSTLKALISGNDLIITTDYEKSINEIKTALENNIIDENLINKKVLRLIAFKYYNNIIK